MIDPLGDGISKVELVDRMGDDLMVVNAARVSFSKRSHYEYDRGDTLARLKDSDAKLIRYLAQHGHWTPFSQPQLQFRIKMPLAIRSQWFKHTVGLTRNERSGRYVTSDIEFYNPMIWRLQAKDKKQGSSGESETSYYWQRAAHARAKDDLYLYNSMIKAGVAAEQARLVLPQSMYTEFIETGSLFAYSRIVGLRAQPDAQLETQKYAEAISSIVSNLFPVAWKELNAARQSTTG